jgi:hypothetical protein
LDGGVMPVLWTWALALGAGGGAVNAVLTQDTQVFPSVMQIAPRRRLVRLGLLGSVAVAASAAMALIWALTTAACLSYESSGDTVALSAAGFLVGLAASRWMTNETDKRLLHAAVCKAAAAPAADPVTVRRMEDAPPHSVWSEADRLMPRHWVH